MILIHLRELLKSLMVDRQDIKIEKNDGLNLIIY